MVAYLIRYRFPDFGFKQEESGRRAAAYLAE